MEENMTYSDGYTAYVTKRWGVRGRVRVSTHSASAERTCGAALGARQGADCALHPRCCLKSELLDFPWWPRWVHAPNAAWV